MKYPKQVPVLTTADFVCGASGCKKQKRHCLLEWCNIVFLPRTKLEKLPDLALDELQPSVDGRVYNRLEDACRAIATKHRLVSPSWWSTRNAIVSFNDNNESKYLVEAWNLFIQKLGYTEIVDV